MIFFHRTSVIGGKENISEKVKKEDKKKVAVWATLRRISDSFTCEQPAFSEDKFRE